MLTVVTFVSHATVGRMLLRPDRHITTGGDPCLRITQQIRRKADDVHYLNEFRFGLGAVYGQPVEFHTGYPLAAHGRHTGDPRVTHERPMGDPRATHG